MTLGQENSRQPKEIKHEPLFEFDPREMPSSKQTGRFQDLFSVRVM